MHLTPTIANSTAPLSSHTGSEGLSRQWLAVYTLPRHEKQISRQLEDRSVQTFLPLYDTVRRWKNGPTRVSLPLFPGYLFVNVDPQERRKVLELPSVLKIIGNRAGASVVSQTEIDQLRQTVETGLAQPHPYLTIGNKVRVIQGPLAGTEGILVRKRGHMKIVISVTLIMQSVAVEVDACDVEPCGKVIAHL